MTETDAAAPDRAPELIAGRIHAVRAWNLISEAGTGRMLLGSLVHHTVWPTGPVSAECSAHLHRGTHVPGPECSCGFYAHHLADVDHEMLAESHEIDQALGVIEAWGRIEVHETGVRAEHVRLVALLADDSAPSEYLDELESAARAYGVGVVSLAGDRALRRYLHRELSGLDEPFVERLLRDSHSHLLEPAACGYISRRGEPVGGFGYKVGAREVRPKRWQNRVPVDERSLIVVRVAGTSHHEEALQSEVFDPGSSLALLLEPDNPGDPNAVGVWDAALERRVGYVPRRSAGEVGARLRAGRVARVDSLWQWRDLRSGRRTGMHLLISATPRVEFSDREQLSLEEETA